MAFGFTNLCITLRQPFFLWELVCDDMNDITLSFQPNLPRIIQGGMGVAVSNWRLAKSVSQMGHLGVVSGTGLDTLFVRFLQDGDPGGRLRRALSHFPFQQWVEPVMKKYFLEGGRKPGQPYARLPMPSKIPGSAAQVLATLACYAEVFLAKEGHSGRVGINLLTKIQLPNLSSLYGAMLAKVDYVLMGAGIPRDIPEVLDRFAAGDEASMRLDITGWTGAEPARLVFDPTVVTGSKIEIPRPNFLPIISSNSLATMLARKINGTIQGFIVEAPTAGGHNAPPRGNYAFDEVGQPVYGERDKVNLQQLAELGLPFWLAGSAGSPDALNNALEQGAAGVQIGTLFAFCDESGFTPEIKERILAKARSGTIKIYTDPKASPTGFPFKVAPLEGTLSDKDVYEARERVCDLGYLREMFQAEEGKVGFRCAAEPVKNYTSRGGLEADTEGRKCLCNSLMAGAGTPQIQKNGQTENILVTSGDEVGFMKGFLSKFPTTGYTAKDVVDYVLSKQVVGI